MEKRELLTEINTIKKDIKKYEKIIHSEDIPSVAKAQNRRLLAEARNRLCALQYDLECAEEQAV